MRPTSVLLVDSADQRDMYAAHLRRSGFVTLEAKDAAEACQVAIGVRPDIIVTEIVLPPPTDGLELTARLKGDPRTRKIPLIVLSGRVFDAERERAIEAGCDIFLSKPCLPPALTEAVRELVAAYRRFPQGRSRPAPSKVLLMPPRTDPRELAILWVLECDGRRARCRVVSHPLGVELRLDVDWRVRQTKVVRHPPGLNTLPDEALSIALAWRDEWSVKGWALPAANVT